MAPIGATGDGAKNGKQARGESGPRFSAVPCSTVYGALCWSLISDAAGV